VIAVAVAIQESGLRNLPGGDADSIGLFQQRPSQGWGTARQLRSPTYQAGKFYDALLKVPNWQKLPLTQAGQAVQRSGFPDAYARWTSTATALVSQIAPGLGPIPPGDSRQPASTTGPPAPPGCLLLDEGDGLPAAQAASLPTGFALPATAPRPVAVAVAWALRQLGTPYSYGGDCTSAHSGDPARQCDCSSLVQQAYRAGGISLPRTTGDQVHAGVPVTDPAHLQPGDLVFIPGSDGTATAPGHVALYLGAGLLVQAPHTGARVQITPVREWSRIISAIRRIVSS
jgi:cell wall-associated NlpC family hydrolase